MVYEGVPMLFFQVSMVLSMGLSDPVPLWPLVHLLLCQISQGGLPLTPKWFLWSLETLSWSLKGFDWLFKSPEGVSAAFEEIPNIIRKNLIDDRPRQECMWSKT